MSSHQPGKTRKATSLPIIRPANPIDNEPNVEEVKWSDIFEDEEGLPKGVLGVP